MKTIPIMIIKGKKGFMHAIEAVIAAILLLTYTSTILQYQKSDTFWPEMKQKQEQREYLTSFNDAGLSRLIVENKPHEFIGITEHFLGSRRYYGLGTIGLLQSNLVIGIMSNESIKINTASNPCPGNVTSEFNCYTGIFKTYDFVLLDNDSDTGNGIEDYDSLFIDSNKNGIYDIYEGPRPLSSAVNISGEIWVFSSVDNATHNVEFIRGEDIVRYRENIHSAIINNRETNISIRAKTNESDIEDIDILIIPSYINLVKIKSKLSRFLDEGKSIIEVANISKNNLDEVQRDIFGLQYLDMETTPIFDRNITISHKNTSDDTYQIGKYFSQTGMRIETTKKYYNLNMTWINSGPAAYDYNCYIPGTDIYLGYVNCTNITDPDPCSTTKIDGIINYVNASEIPPSYCKIGTKTTPNIYHSAEIDIRGNIHMALLINTTGVGYNQMFVDINHDRNMTNDGPPTSEGKIIKIDITNFTIKTMEKKGRYIEIMPSSEHKFKDAPLEKLYTTHNDTEYIIMKEGREYNITPYLIGTKITVNTASIGTGTCTSGLVFGNGYRYNSSAWPLPYPFTITNISQGYNILNIDLNSNGRCDDPGEGPYYSGDFVRIGPEYYRIDISTDGSKVDWTLKERWQVPSAISNHKKNTRRTAWIGGNITSDDEWHILNSIILWSSSHRSELVESSKASENIIKSTLIENRELFQPYEVNFRIGAFS